MVYAPIYKDIFYTTSSSELEWVLRLTEDDSDKGIVFKGRSIKSPSSDLLYINISKYCRDWLSIHLSDVHPDVDEEPTPWAEIEDDFVIHPNAYIEFDLLSGELLLEKYKFLYCWEGEWDGDDYCLSSPINGKADPRMKLFITEYNVNGTTPPVFETEIIIDLEYKPTSEPIPYIPQTGWGSNVGLSGYVLNDRYLIFNRNDGMPWHPSTVPSNAFSNCTTAIGIGFHVKTLETMSDNIFNGCPNITSISIWCGIAPSVTSNTFNGLPNGGVLHCLPGSTGYEAWLSYLPSGWSIEYDLINE